MTTDKPPVPKYKLTVTIEGNTKDEVEHDLAIASNDFFHATYDRDELEIIGGRRQFKLEHTNPEQTPEAYDEALSEWSANRKRARRANA